MNLEVPKVMQRFFLHTLILFIGLSEASVIMAASDNNDTFADIEDLNPHPDDFINREMRRLRTEAAAKQREKEIRLAHGKHVADQLLVQRNLEILSHGEVQKTPYDPHGTNVVDTLKRRQSLTRNRVQDLGQKSNDQSYSMYEKSNADTRTNSLHESNLDGVTDLEELKRFQQESLGSGAVHSADRLVANNSMSPAAQAVARMNQATKKGWNYTSNSQDGSLANLKNYVGDQEQLSDTAKIVKQLQEAHTIPRTETTDHQQLSKDMAKNKYNYVGETIESYHKRMTAKSGYSFTAEPLTNFYNGLKNSGQEVVSGNNDSGSNHPPSSMQTGQGVQSASNRIKTDFGYNSNVNEDGSAIWNIPTYPLAFTAINNRSCNYVNPTKASLNLDAIKDTKQKEVIERCLKDKRNQSFECVHFLATAAEKAFSTKPECRGRLTAEKLLCVIKFEASEPATYRHCNRYKTTNKANACGLTQITKSGAATVLRGITNFDLANQFDNYLDLVGRSEFKNQKCSIINQTARDRDLAIVMGATHLCAQYVNRPGLNPVALHTEYNVGEKKAGLIGWSNSYAKKVVNCERKANQQLASHEMKIALSASCHASDSCTELSRSGGSSLKKSAVDWDNLGGKK